MNAERLRWYVARARRMSAGEVVSRVGDLGRQRAWAQRQVRRGQSTPAIQPSRPRPFPTKLDPAVATKIPSRARAALIADAERLLSGQWETLGVVRDDLEAPDWFRDPVTGRRAPSDQYAFKIQHRSEDVTGNVKQVWELSRHQHLTVLAAAFFVTGDDRYAERVDRHLRSWWDENPFLSGVHWTSGIEVGLRLVAWVWIRRLLDAWPSVGDLFERNELAARQIYWHQQYLAGFRSSGSSANNHVIAEAVGRLAAACAFPWFDESDEWRTAAQALFESELERNTFRSGVNRELASEYHGFVTELAFCAAVEADATGLVFAPSTWQRICAMTDVAAALVDATGRPPRQGDGDHGIALRVDGAEIATDSWGPILALGAAVFGPASWWPAQEPTVFSTLLGSLCREYHGVPGRPDRRPAHIADAGITVLRTGIGSDSAEVWCRCDGGPHGFLATAAHAHSDALSIEVRHGGVDILADPGTYCYHGEPAWRSYFRSTAGHNTVELDRRDQSRSGGPFLWATAAKTRVLAVAHADDEEVVSWSAEHDGYTSLSPSAVHRRTVRLDATGRRLTIVDEIDTSGDHPLALNFHFGPAVEVGMSGSDAHLTWSARDRDATVPAQGTLRLPSELHWSVHRGETDPIRGWYSPEFGVRVPSVTIEGTGRCRSGPIELHTELEFHD